MSGRPPYDETDAARVRRYLKQRGRRLVDPLGADSHPNDPYFAPSLACARHQMLAAFGATRPDGTRLRAFPVFVESHRPNAFAADLGKGLHLCGINTGMVTSLFELAAFTFSQADLFPEVGNPAAESSPNLPRDSLLGYWIADRVVAALPTQATAVGEELIPRDPDRRLMAHFLTQIMLRFVWLHELFHGFNGHSGYIAASGLLGAELREMPDEDELSVMEIDDPIADGLPWHELQPALEFNADRAAFRMMIGLQQAGDEPFALLAEQPPTLRLKLTHYAAVLITFLFDQAAKRRTRHGNTHPAGQSRRQYLIQTTAGGIMGNAAEEKDNLLHALAEIDSLQTRISILTATESLLPKPSADLPLDELVRINAFVRTISKQIDFYAFAVK